MPRGERKGDHQKQKMLRLEKIFMEETDEQHPLTMAGIISRLSAAGVNADRKTLYQDMEELRLFGLDVIGEKRGRQTYYYLGQRSFELPELKLLVDTVQSARFITERKSRELIRKLEGLTSRHAARHLQRQVTVSGRIKAMNESIYYNVDRLHEAIADDRQIRFQYFQWNEKKEMVLRRGGAWYRMSPWALLWAGNNYYLVAYDAEDGIIRHFRVDKMLRISAQDTPREGREQFRAFDLAKYAESLFGMFGGEIVRVTLEAENELASVLIDRFGKDIPMIPAGEGHFRTHVDVAVSRQFYGWIFGLGGVRIVAPQEIADGMRDALSEALGTIATTRKTGGSGCGL